MFTNKITSALTAVAMLAAPALAVAPAHAASTVASSEGGETKQVRINDLDLRSEAGQRKMEKRIRAAALDVCRYNTDREIASVREQRDCVRIALQKSKDQMATAVNNARFGG